jgi:hypothetical protein
MKLEAQEQQMKAKKEASGACCSELKVEVQELKQTLDSVVAELWKLKVKLAKPEPKQIVIDYSVFLGFVGVLIGVVIACMWK